MKKLLTIIALLISSICFAQKAKTETPTHEYKKIAVIGLDDLNNFGEALSQWKRLVMFDPNTTPEEKVNTFRTIDAYTNSLSTKVKIDSVQTDIVKVIAPPKNKKLVINETH